jgi:hypothetical protein
MMNFAIKNGLISIIFQITVKPVYNDHPWDREKVVVVQRWSLFRGSLRQNIIFKLEFFLYNNHMV